MTTHTGRPLRADAERNRRRILEAAARVFAQAGLDAGFDDVAREAGVGVGTVYRRFPDREELLIALFEERLERIAELVAEAEAEPDAGAGLYRFMEGMAAQHVADRGLKELVYGQADCAARMGGIRQQIVPVIDQVVKRAQEQGVLRPDVGASDVALAVFAVSSVGALTVDADPDQWRRQLALAWSGLCRPTGTGGTSTEQLPLPGTALHPDQLSGVFNRGRP